MVRGREGGGAEKQYSCGDGEVQLWGIRQAQRCAVQHRECSQYFVIIES